MANNVTKKFDPVPPNKVGERLKWIRLKRNCKQEDVAKNVLNVSHVTLGYYEGEERTIPYDAIVKPAKHYEVTTDFLLLMNDNPTNKINDGLINYELGLTPEAIGVLRFYQELMNKDMTDDKYYQIARFVLHNVNSNIKLNGKDYLVDPLSTRNKQVTALKEQRGVK